jgi:type IV fimbrial biogenesis protein FimT
MGQWQLQLLGDQKRRILLMPRPGQNLIQPSPPISSRGMTLIELMVGLAIMALLLMSGAPAFSDWIRNIQIRSASESLLNGLQHARTEAVRRNIPTRFQLVDSLEANCGVSNAGRNWVVNLDQNRRTSPAGGCDKTADGQNDPFILQKTAATSSAAVTINAARGAFAFNGLGQQIAVDGAAASLLSTINITSSQGACVKPDGSGGTARCLRIEISLGGQMRLCDPGLPDTPANRAMSCEPL